jgi:hypothetical protein
MFGQKKSLILILRTRLLWLQIIGTLDLRLNT